MLGRVPLTLVVTIVSVGCASGNLLATARTVTKGEHQLALGVEGLVMPVEGRVVPGGNVEGSLRFGLSDGLDLGLTASLLSFEQRENINLLERWRHHVLG